MTSPPENAVSGNEPKLENGTGQKPNAQKSELAELLRYLVPHTIDNNANKPGDTENG